MRILRDAMAALALASVAATGCSSSSTTTIVPVTDSGSDGNTTTDANGTDGKTGGDTGTDGQTVPEGGNPDGPCNFAAFVIGLIDTDTSATATPSTNLGQSCTDDQKQSDFAVLFP